MALVRSIDDARNAGMIPASTPDKRLTMTLNASTRPSIRILSESGTGMGRSSDVTARVSHDAMSRPPTAPNSERRTLSVTSCRISRLRVAPMASRTLISFCRADARASSIPATFAHATISTRPTATIRPIAARPSPLSAAGCSRTSRVATSDMRRSLFVCA
jgi:hypothetical protein